MTNKWRGSSRDFETEMAITEASTGNVAQEISLESIDPFRGVLKGFSIMLSMVAGG